MPSTPARKACSSSSISRDSWTSEQGAQKAPVPHALDQSRRIMSGGERRKRTDKHILHRVPANRIPVPRLEARHALESHLSDACYLGRESVEEAA